MNLILKELQTPIEHMYALATDSGVCMLNFHDGKFLQRHLSELSRHFGKEITTGSNSHLDALEQQLDEYFAGARREFTVALVPVGTEFQQVVWQTLCTIPYGSTLSYGAEAAAMHRRAAVRAVANANAANKISILVPCHRVIGADGSLTGYGGKLWRKEFLLNLEKTYTEKDRRIKIE
jgi:AraC family transcriptional regulator of adaptative response/methylated-DNA-[protein]-cysteine methyltransferase